MAQDDMHVVMYKILAYLYSCMKKGEQPVERHYAHDGDVLSIPYQYWASVMAELSEGGYVKGVTVIEAWGGDRIVRCPSPSITMKGVEFLQENSTMRKAANFLKETKSMLPFI
jgi:hypothetical protein